MEKYKLQNEFEDKILLLKDKSLEEIALFITSIKQTFFEKMTKISQNEVTDTYSYKKTNQNK